MLKPFREQDKGYLAAKRNTATEQSFAPVLMRNGRERFKTGINSGKEFLRNGRGTPKDFH